MSIRSAKESLLQHGQPTLGVRLEIDVPAPLWRVGAEDPSAAEDSPFCYNMTNGLLQRLPFARDLCSCCSPEEDEQLEAEYASVRKHAGMRSFSVHRVKVNAIFSAGGAVK
eukprot:4016205-Amphidinium_carterae.1